MTSDQIKDILPILKAYSEGKTIQFKDPQWMDTWILMKELDIKKIQDFLEGHITFRVKPESKYVPFETKEECWEEMLKHQPFSWITFTKQGIKQPIVSVAEDELMLDAYPDEHLSYTFKEALDSFQFADGTPFGKLVEQ